ncbi:MAG: cyanophycinase [Planctomycetaceae bacterium]
MRWPLWLLFSLGCLGPLFGDEQKPLRPESIRPINGSLVIVGGGIIPPEIISRFLELGGGAKARLVVVTTASMLADDPLEMNSRLQMMWKDRQTASFTVLHTRSREQADDPEFTRPLDDATAVWFVGGNQNAIIDAYLGTLTDKKFHGVIERGGVIGGTSAGAAIMSRVMIGGTQPAADGQRSLLVRTGMGFAPGLIVDQHFRKRNRQARLIEALEQWPGLVGVGIDEGTALIIRGSTAEVMGDSDVTLALGSAPGKPAKTDSLAAGQTADLAALSRAAISRMPAIAPRPAFQHGTLMLVGAGDAPEEVREQFLEAAGGSDAAIVVISAGDADSGKDLQLCDWLRSAGASNVKAVVARSRQEIESPEFLSILADASGIWLGDAPLRRMVDAYVDTSVQRVLEKLLERGGVIAASAAGATLSGLALPATAEANELPVVSEAYERGLGFLPGMILLSTGAETPATSGQADLITRHPQLLSVELTESTALIVRGSTMQVVGKNPVTVVGPRSEDSKAAAAPRGARGNLQPRRS